MKTTIIFLIVFILIFVPVSQGIVIEKNNSIEIENKNFSVTFFKNIPLLEMNINNTVYNFYISSILFNDGIHIHFRNIIWKVNFTKLNNNVYDFNLISFVSGYKIHIDYIFLNGQKYLNFSGNGILVHIYISGKPSPSVIIFEHISFGKMNIIDAEYHENFSIKETSKTLPLEKINMYSKNSTFYISNKNSTETDLYQIYPDQNGTVQSFSFISFGTFQKEFIFNAEAIIFITIGVIVGSMIIFAGILYQRKKD